MREILFRGKRIAYGDWIVGSLWVHLGLPQILTAANTVAYDVDPATVGQYTGLTDKNGKRIFEGDLVSRFHNVPCVVFWNQEGAAFEARWNRHGQVFYNTLCGADSLTVIGNIHDNPELIGGKTDA